MHTYGYKSSGPLYVESVYRCLAGNVEIIHPISTISQNVPLNERRHRYENELGDNCTRES